jgi:hypothetical protein
MCLLFSTAASMKLWEAPPSIRTETLYPCKTPLILKVLNLGNPLIDAKVAFSPAALSSSGTSSFVVSEVSASMFCI